MRRLPTAMRDFTGIPRRPAAGSTVSGGSGGVPVRNSASSSAIAGPTRSGRVLSTCPSLIKVVPSSVMASRTRASRDRLLSWRARESFLVDLQNTRRGIAELSREADDKLRGMNARTDAAETIRALQQRLRTLSRSASSLASGFNGSGVRSGTLRPPTDAHRDQKQRIDLAVEEVRAALGAVGR